MKKSLIFLVLLLAAYPVRFLHAAEPAAHEDESLDFEDDNGENLAELGSEEESLPAAEVPQKPVVPAPAIPKLPVKPKEAPLKAQTQQDLEVQKILAQKPAIVGAAQEVKTASATAATSAQAIVNKPTFKKTLPSAPSKPVAAVLQQVPVKAEVPALPKVQVPAAQAQMPETPVKAEKFIPPAVSQDGLYRFADYFPEAEAKIFNKKSGEFLAPGFTADNKILFKGYEIFGDISVLPVNIQGATERAISFNLIPGSMHQLLFKDFHPGQKLTLQYILLQRYQTQTPQFVYLKILVGEKEVKRIQIASNESWRTETLDLGIVSFLNKGVSFRFEVSSDDSKGLRLNLIPQLKN